MNGVRSKYASAALRRTPSCFDRFTIINSDENLGRFAAKVSGCCGENCIRVFFFAAQNQPRVADLKCARNLWTIVDWRLVFLKSPSDFDFRFGVLGRELLGFLLSNQLVKAFQPLAIILEGAAEFYARYNFKDRTCGKSEGASDRTLSF